MGIVNILKTLSQSAGPWATGLLAGHGHFWVAFVTAGSLKGTYDLLLLAFFAGRVHRPEQAGVDAIGTQSGDSSRAPETILSASEDESEAGASSATSIAEDEPVAKNPFGLSGSNRS